MEKYYNYEDLSGVVPIVRPRLMLDRLAVNPEAGQVRAVKTVSIDEQLFVGHFPGNPILPGVLQVAAMLQAAKGLIGHRDGLERAREYSLSTAKKAKFRCPVYPGDRLDITAQITQEDANTVTLQCDTSVAGTKTCEAILAIARQSARERPLTTDTFAPALRDLGADKLAKPIDINTIMQRIPHRYPFLFIDRILLMDEKNHRIAALKNVTGNEPFFAGPNPAVLPGYVQAEIAAQAGCALALSEPGNENKLAVFMSIDQCHFYEAVIPGDQLLIDVKVTPRGRFGKGHGELYVGTRLVSDIDLKFAIVDRE